MAQKNATPTKEQQAALCKAGKDWRYFSVIRDLPHSLIVRDKRSNEVSIVEK